MSATVVSRAATSISGDSVPSGLFLTPDMIDWSKKVVQREDAPLWLAIGRGKAPEYPVVKLPWGWSYPDSDGDQLNGAISSTSATAWVVDDASKFQVGNLALCESEIVRLTAVNEDTNTLTVDRGYAGTTAATHVDNMSIIILPPAIAELQATPISVRTLGESDYNYMQQMEFGIEFSHRAEVIPTLESRSLKVTGQMAAEVKKKMTKTIPNFLENALLFGSRAIGTTANASTMGGIFATSSFVTTSNTSLSGALTYGTLMSNIQTVHNLVGNEMGRTIMAHPQVCAIISSFFEDTRRTSGSDTSIKTYWKTIDTGWFGEFTLMPNYKMQKTAANGDVALDKLLVFNPSDLEVVPLSGDSGWSSEPMDVSGAWAKAVAIRGDLTLRAQNPDTRLILGGFSTTLSDYSGLA